MGHMVDTFVFYSILPYASPFGGPYFHHLCYTVYLLTLVVSNFLLFLLPPLFLLFLLLPCFPEDSCVKGTQRYMFSALLVFF